jgi:nucleotide-binding universal stress UspA family protein
MFRTILVPLTAALPAETLLDAALALARRMSANIHAMFILPNPHSTLAYLPDVVLAAGLTREIIERETQEAAAEAKGRFTSWRTRNNLPETAGGSLDTCFAAWAEQIGEIETVVTRWGRLVDLIVVPKPALSAIQAHRCFDAAVFGSGRPTLVAGDETHFDVTDHIMIAWNGSLEASRAVFGAMPLLHLAGRVSIFAVPQYDIEDVDPADLAEYLSWHGIRAHPIAGPKGEHATGAALVSAASEQQACLIVMGAYTHSRLRQSFLGGVTRHLLAHAPVPLLMSRVRGTAPRLKLRQDPFRIHGHHRHYYRQAIREAGCPRTATLSHAAGPTFCFVRADALSQKGNPGPGKAGVPASDRILGGILIARGLRIVGSALDELICIKSFMRQHAAPPSHVPNLGIGAVARHSFYSSSSRTACSNTRFDKGFCKTSLMPSSAARRSIAGSVVAVIMIAGTRLPRVRSSETNSRPFRPGN